MSTLNSNILCDFWELKIKLIYDILVNQLCKEFSVLTINYLKYVLALILTITIHSQSVQHRFVHLGVNDGLSQNMINSIVQDSIGFIWFGTKDGLNRYDGYNFKVFRNNINNNSSISDNYINSIYVDKKGRMWVGTRNGINLFDPKKDSFKRFETNPIIENPGIENSVKRISEDKHGSIWAAFENGNLAKISDSKVVKFYLTKTALPPTELLDFEIDNNGNFWMSFGDGLYIVVPETSSKSIKLNKKSSRLVYSLLSDGEHFWGGSEGEIVKFNINNLEANPSSYKLFGEGTKYDTWLYAINDIIRADASTILLSTSYGLVSFNSNSEKVTLTQKKANYPFSLSANNLITLFADKSKNLWIGTSGYGINKSKLLANNFEYYSCSVGRDQTLSVLFIREDIEGNIWFGNMGNLIFKLNKNTGSAEQSRFSSSVQMYHDFHFSDYGTWGLRGESLVKFNSSHQLEKSFKGPFLDGSRAVFEQIIEIDSSFIWIASEKAVIAFDIVKSKFEVFSYPYDFSIKVLSNLKGLNDDLWIGTNIGLFRFNKSKKSWEAFKAGKNSLSNSRVKSILLDPENPGEIIWIGTDGGGLNKLHLSSKKVEIFTSENGLPNDVIYGILSDENNYLWLSTNNGLSRFNSSTKVFRNYNVYDGLQDNEFNSRAYFKSKSGKLYFGGINGITAFNPTQLNLNKTIPEVFITDFKMFNKEVLLDSDGSPLSDVIGYTKELIFPFYKNNFGFQFTALDFTAPQNNRYKYMLENFDEKWIELGTKREAFYTNIPPGEYLFRVIGSNNDRIWNQNGTSIKIIINPPFWQTWWAYLLYAILFVYGVYLYFGYQKKKLLIQKKIAVSELERKKYLELNNLKGRFLTNITHEFRTPLTLILGPIEELKNKVTDTDDKQKLDNVTKNANQLLKLVNQLLDLARLDKGKIPLNNRKGNLVNFITDLIETMIPLAAQKGIKLVFNAEAREIHSQFDPNILDKIISNLLSNSIKFTPNNGTINITVTPPQSDSESTIIIFEDEGVGIINEDLQNIFNPFFRSETLREFSQDGYGIGLSLTKELVELLGGKISVESSPGIKTAFTIELPLTIDSLVGGSNEIIYHHKEAVSIGSNRDIATTDKNVSSLDDKIVLIIDDVKEMRNYISDITKNEFKIITASDGTEGFEKAKELIPDLIISDIMMPGISGYELLKKLKKEGITSHIPVILLTAKADEESKLKGLEIGADDYILKPFNTTELIIRSKNLMQARDLLKAKYRSTDFSTVVEPPKSQEEIFLLKVTGFIQLNIQKEDLTVEEIANHMNLSHSQVYRKLKSLTGQSPVQFVTSYRLKKGAELLKQKAGNISEIAYLVGFQNPSYFAQCFKKEFNCTPLEYSQQN